MSADACVVKDRKEVQEFLDEILQELDHIAELS